MAARRLLIVMLILLGLSTLAAALIPQRTLRDGNPTQSTTRSTTTTTTTPAEPPPGRALSAPIAVGGKKVPVVAGPVCPKRIPRCEPIHVGDRLSLQVTSKKGVQLEFPEFGQFGFAAPAAPAFFELLLDTPGRFGILFADPEDVPACGRAVDQGSPCVAARIEVLTEAAARKAIAPKPKKPKSRARAGSGRP